MPKPYPKQFCDEVVPVALNREDGVRIADTAKDFGIAESCVGNWLEEARRGGKEPEARLTPIEFEMSDPSAGSRRLSNRVTSKRGSPPSGPRSLGRRPGDRPGALRHRNAHRAHHRILFHLPREPSYREKPRKKNGLGLAGYGAITTKNALARVNGQ